MMTFDSGDGDSSLAVSPYIAIATTDEAATVEVTSPVALLVEEQDYQLISTRAVTDADTEHTLSLPPHSRVVLRLPAASPVTLRTSPALSSTAIPPSPPSSDTPAPMSPGRGGVRSPRGAAAPDRHPRDSYYLLMPTRSRQVGTIVESRGAVYWRIVAHDLRASTSSRRSRKSRSWPPPTTPRRTVAIASSTVPSSSPPARSASSALASAAEPGERRHHCGGGVISGHQSTGSTSTERRPATRSMLLPTRRTIPHAITAS